MQTKILFFLPFFFLNVYCQTEIDEHLTIDFPGIVERIDTVVGGEKASYFIVVVDSNEVYMVTRTLPEFAKNEEVQISDKEQQAMYRGMIKGQTTQMEIASLSQIDSTKISIQGLAAYKITYGDKQTNTPMIVMLDLILDRTLYAVTYSCFTDFNKGHSEKFFNSIVVKNVNQPVPHSERRAERIGEAIGKFVGQGLASVVVVVIIFFAIKQSKKNKNKGPDASA